MVSEACDSQTISGGASDLATEQSGVEHVESDEEMVGVLFHSSIDLRHAAILRRST